MKSIFSSLGLLVGVIVGAGMFAIPYAVVQAGIVWASIHLVITFFLLTFLHLLYGEIILRTQGKHRLPGYARLYVGERLAQLSFGSAMFGFYGALLAYGILGGIFLEQLLDGTLPAWVFTLLFLCIGGLLLATDLREVGVINFFLTIPLILLVLVLAALAYPHAYASNIGWGVSSGSWFLPYGVLLFAFAGASAIPDAADALGKRRKGVFRRIVVWGTIIPLIVYAFFVYATAGVSGVFTSKDAISGLEWLLGRKVVVLGSLIGLLAVFTSFLSLGTDLKNIFIYDYGWKRSTAWFTVILVPVLLYILGVSDFVRTISLVGAVAIGIDGVTILLIALAMRGRDRIVLEPYRPLLWILAVGLLAAVGYEIAIVAT